MPMSNSPHPGEFIRTEIIEPAGLSVTAASAALRVSRPALSSLLNGKAGLSGDMALRLEDRERAALNANDATKLLDDLKSARQRVYNLNFRQEQLDAAGHNDKA